MPTDHREPLADEPRVHREVVSFVRRSARMNQSQQRNWDTWHSRYLVEVPRTERSTSVHPDATVDWAEVFHRSAPLIVEIGSGNGEALAATALARPDANVVAFEVFEPAVATTMGRLARHQVDNVKIVLADGVEGLTQLFGSGHLAEIHVFFADPWHKARHHKRRLVNDSFAELVSDRLQPQGVLRLATDWADYAEWMREVLDQAPALRNEYPAAWAPRFPTRPVTKYEQRGIDAGRTILDLTYRRV